MSILIYFCGPLHPKAMNGVCVGRKKESNACLHFSSRQAWKAGEGKNLGISAISWNLVPYQIVRYLKPEIVQVYTGKV